jgi:hypothetical protein
LMTPPPAACLACLWEIAHDARDDIA